MRKASAKLSLHDTMIVVMPRFSQSWAASLHVQVYQDYAESLCNRLGTTVGGVIFWDVAPAVSH